MSYAIDIGGCGMYGGHGTCKSLLSGFEFGQIRFGILQRGRIRCVPLRTSGYYVRIMYTGGCKHTNSYAHYFMMCVRRTVGSHQTSGITPTGTFFQDERFGSNGAFFLGSSSQALHCSSMQCCL